MPRVSKKDNNTSKKDFITGISIIQHIKSIISNYRQRSSFKFVFQRDYAMLQNHVNAINDYDILDNCVTPLHYAVIQNDETAVYILLRKYARVQFKHQVSALSLSIILNYGNIFDVLFEDEKELLGVDHYLALRFAIYCKRAEMIKRLIPFESGFLAMFDKQVKDYLTNNSDICDEILKVRQRIPKDQAGDFILPTPLIHEAVIANNLAEVKRHKNQFLHNCIHDDQLFYPIQLADELDRTEIMKYLQTTIEGQLPDQHPMPADEDSFVLELTDFDYEASSDHSVLISDDEASALSCFELSEETQTPTDRATRREQPMLRSSVAKIRNNPELQKTQLVTHIRVLSEQAVVDSKTAGFIQSNYDQHETWAEELLVHSKNIAHYYQKSSLVVNELRGFYKMLAETPKFKQQFRIESADKFRFLTKIVDEVAVPEIIGQKFQKLSQAEKNQYQQDFDTQFKDVHITEKLRQLPNIIRFLAKKLMVEVPTDSGCLLEPAEVYRLFTDQVRKVKQDLRVDGVVKYYSENQKMLAYEVQKPAEIIDQTRKVEEEIALLHAKLAKLQKALRE